MLQINGLGIIKLTPFDPDHQKTLVVLVGTKKTLFFLPFIVGQIKGHLASGSKSRL